MKSDSNAFIVNGEKCNVNYFNFQMLRVEAEQTQDYFDSKYMEIGKVLDPEKEYLETLDKADIIFDESVKVGDAEYRQGRIKFHPDTLKSNNMGFLVHEGAHHIQNYPQGIGRDHPYSFLMEGLAEYCRYLIARDVELVKGNPENGYEECAHFLQWLTEQYGKGVIEKVNELIYEQASN